VRGLISAGFGRTSVVDINKFSGRYNIVKKINN